MWNGHAIWRPETGTGAEDRFDYGIITLPQLSCIQYVMKKNFYNSEALRAANSSQMSILCHYHGYSKYAEEELNRATSFLGLVLHLPYMVTMQE